MSAPIVISILANSRGAVSGIASVRGSLTKMAIPLAAAGGGLALLGKAAVKSASDAQQSMGATETVFAKSSDKIIAKSKKAAKQYGLSANTYRENANLIGSLLKNQGVAQDQLAGKTDKMIGTASDLAATFGGTTTDAVGALSSALKGEFDPLERYGISLKQSTVNAEAMKVAHVNGAAAFGKLTAKQQAAAKQQATTNLIMKQSKDSMGAFGRETNTFAHQTQVLGAQWENFKATLGTYLLPVLTRTVAFISRNAPAALAVLQTKLLPVIAAVRGFFSGITSGGGQAGAIFVQFKATVSEALTNVKSIFTSTVSIVTSLWDRFGSDLTILARSTLGNLITFIRGALNVVTGIFKTVAALLRGDWSGAWAGIQQIARGALQAVVAVVRQGGALVRAAFSIGLKAVTSIVRGIFGGLRDAAAAGVSKLVSLVKSLPGKIRDGIPNPKKLLYDIGGFVVDGLVDGIKGAAGKVTGAVKGIAGKVTGGLKGALSIFSPSRVTRQLGRYVSEGMALGMLDGVDGIVSSVRQTGAKTKAALKQQTSEILTQIRTAGRERLDALITQRNEYATAIRDSARQFAGLGGMQLDEGESVTTDGIIGYFQKRLNAVRGFNANLAKIKGKVSKSLYDQVAQMGVEQGGDYARALANASPEALASIKSLSYNIDRATSALGNNTATAMYGAGVQSAQGYYDGLQAMLKKIEKQGVKISKALVRSLKKALDINSPSRVTRNLGMQTVAGFDQGLDAREIQAKGQQLAKSLVKGYANPQLDAQFTAGYRASDTAVAAKATGDTYITVEATIRLDNTMTEAQQGVQIHRALKAAVRQGLVPTEKP